MYLYVFVFIILTVLSVHTQLFTVNVARLADQQTAVASIMFTYHHGLYKYAKTNVDIASMGDNTNCVVSFSTGTKCQKVGGADSYLLGNTIGTKRYLPPNFDFNFIRTKFSSYVFKDAGGTRVITFAMNGTIAMGLAPDQIMKQIVKLDYPLISYGSVYGLTCAGGVGRSFQTNSFRASAGGQTVSPCFDLPNVAPAGLLPIGSIGIISYM